MFEDQRDKIFWETELIVTALGKDLYNLLMYCGFNFLKLLSCNQNLLVGNFASRGFSQNTASLSGPLKKMHLDCSLRIALIIFI